MEMDKPGKKGPKKTLNSEGSLKQEDMLRE